MFGFIESISFWGLRFLIYFLDCFSSIPLSILAVGLLATAHKLWIHVVVAVSTPLPFVIVVYILYMSVQYDCYLLSSLLWSSLCGCFLVACLLRSHVLSNLYHFKPLKTCQLPGLVSFWARHQMDDVRKWSGTAETIQNHKSDGDRQIPQTPTHPPWSTAKSRLRHRERWEKVKDRPWTAWTTIHLHAS